MLELKDGSTERTGEHLVEVVHDDPTGDRYRRIRCPKCGWRPRPHDRWMCGTGCRHVWNTFDTGGVCPACGRRWHDTVCLSCLVWSAHVDWYVREDDDSR